MRRPITGAQAVSALGRLRHTALNFEPGPPERFTPEDGWQIDDYCVVLPSEPPGPPVHGGTWEIARELAADYEFADPSIVRAAWSPDEPLERRTMVLEGRFLWMHFLLGVRVSAVTDEIRTVDGREVRVWGWSYRTLEGHLERGQMDYEVWKWLGNGQVEFRMHAFSQEADIADPLERVGFALFGRYMQKKFARRALDRMRDLVHAELNRRPGRNSANQASECPPTPDTVCRSARHPLARGGETE